MRLIAAAPVAAYSGLRSDSFVKLAGELRAELGNTNYQCVIDKLDEARAAVAKATGATP
jgi:hypothetical protein